MHTTTQAEFKQTGFSRDQGEEAILYSKLRRVNIQYGEHIPVYQSANRRYGSLRNSAKVAHLTAPLSSKTIKEEDLEGFHKSSYVRIGNEDLANAYFAATSKTFFNEKGQGERDPVIQTSEKQMSSNFSIGHPNNQFQKTTAMKE
jgi:hypothetical protein